MGREMPHNLKLRQEILKLRGRRRPRAGIDSNPIETYVQAKLAQAKKSRRAANDLAQTGSRYPWNPLSARWRSF